MFGELPKSGTPGGWPSGVPSSRASSIPTPLQGGRSGRSPQIGLDPPVFPSVGLPGSLAGAAFLNLLAAGIVIAVQRVRVGIGAEEEEAQAPADPKEERVTAPAINDSSLNAAGRVKDRRLLGLLLGVSFLTAVASFAYEIGWIRMLSLVMGSATHSFEVMLSAFILGLALGALFIRRKADAGLESLSYLGWIQWFMGLTALATLPLYASTFEVMAFW